MNDLERWGDIVFFLIKGSPETQVDLDHLVRKPDEKLIAPGFSANQDDMRLVAYVGAPVQLDLSAKGGGVRITSLDLPKDASLNATAGIFLWNPKQEGTFEFVAMASDEEFITPMKVRIDVMADRAKAVEKIAEAHDPEAAYVDAGVKRCKQLYDDALTSIKGPDEPTFYRNLTTLQSAFDQLQPLTPRLPDGTMDFPKIVASSDIGAQIALLADGNDDTFPVYLLAKDLDYVFDFGEGFRFSATAFEMEGRLNFEIRTLDTAFLGSNDGKDWTQLTPEITTLPTEMTRVEVDPAQRDARFRFLRIRKTGGKSGGLFEPSELRIHGQRHEAN
jgi:hypothetical protein